MNTGHPQRNLQRDESRRQMTDEQIPRQDKSSQKEADKKPAYRSRARRLLIGFLLTLLVLSMAFLVWMYFPVLQEVINGTLTPTLLPPSPTATLTSTPTITPTSTPQPPPTHTPLPASAYAVNPQAIYPPVPALALEAVVLNDDSSVQVEPAFDHPQWYSSEQIAQQIGVLISEPFYATIGSGSAAWQMDVPLRPGLYEIFVLDTLYSSGGSLDFRVFLGGSELAPLLGIQQVDYRTLSASPAQMDDEWRSIGLYSLETQEILSISTSWEAREMATIVAIDRILIVRQPDSILSFYHRLPANSPKFVVDEQAADVESEDILYTRSDLPAWGDQFLMVVNTHENSQVTWRIPNLVPAGQYEIWVWAPAMQGSADVLYKVLVNGLETGGAVVANTSNMPENQWVSLGTWQVVSPDGRRVELGLRLIVPRDTPGEVAIDAVAFIFRQ